MEVMNTAARRSLLACFPGRALGPSDAIETITHPLTEALLVCASVTHFARNNRVVALVVATGHARPITMILILITENEQVHRCITQSTDVMEILPAMYATDGEQLQLQ